jgi:AcrR family transcriptional regulator
VARPIGAEDVHGAGAGVRERKKVESQSRILEAAEVIFFRDGFKESNLDEVAECAGVAKGTLYRYFDNKAELYVAVLTRDAERFEAKLARLIDPGLTPPEQVRRLGRFYLRHYVDHPGYFQIFWALENQELIGQLPASVVEEVTNLWRRNLGLLAGALERGVCSGHFAANDVWETAHILWTLANGLIQSELSPQRRRLRGRSLERVFDDAIGLVLRGLTRDG